MKSIEEIIDAVLRLADKPHNPITAMIDLAETINQYKEDLKYDRKEFLDLAKDNKELQEQNSTLEAENTELRKIVAQHGIKYRGRGEAA